MDQNIILYFFHSFSHSSVGKESACNAGDLNLIPGLGRSPGEGIVYSLQYSWAPLVVQKVRESACNVGDLGSIPGLGRSPGERKGYPLQYSFITTKKLWFLALIVIRVFLAPPNPHIKRVKKRSIHFHSFSHPVNMT